MFSNLDFGELEKTGHLQYLPKTIQKVSEAYKDIYVLYKTLENSLQYIIMRLNVMQYVGGRFQVEYVKLSLYSTMNMNKTVTDKNINVMKMSRHLTIKCVIITVNSEVIFVLVFIVICIAFILLWIQISILHLIMRTFLFILRFLTLLRNVLITTISILRISVTRCTSLLPLRHHKNIEDRWNGWY